MEFRGLLVLCVFDFDSYSTFEQILLKLLLIALSFVTSVTDVCLMSEYLLIYFLV